MNTALLITTDGRLELLEQTIASLESHVNLDDFAWRVICDDSGHDPTREEIRRRFADRYEILCPSGERAGQDLAIAAAWKQLYALQLFDWVFHIEDDYLFDEIPVDEMVALLERQPHLKQVALKRQAWFPREKRAGGLMEADPEAYTDCSDEHAHWVEHARHWTFNPCVYSIERCRRGYLQGRRHELRYGRALISLDPDARFAYWGQIDDPPRCRHIGLERVGIGY